MPMPELSANARTVLERRYLDGESHETAGDLFRRVAAVVAAADARYGDDPRRSEARFLARMERLEFLPNSPTLMNAGRPLGQLAACFVIPVGDSMAEIFDAVKWAAMIQMTGGGTGFSFSRLRAAGDLVASTRREASGPLAFMDVFNTATDAIRQGGTRRGANMGVLRVDHPDILGFITAKLEPGRLRNFNISVAITDEFMAMVESGGSYALLSPRTGQVVRRLSASKVFELLVNAAWASGDPGVLFIDRINASHPTPRQGAIESTNPCGEQPLLPFESCVLGSLNVARFVAADGEGFDWDRLGEAIDDAVHFLDNVVDANRYPLPEIERVTRTNRKIGLGPMGFADALILMGAPYDAPRALELAGELAAFLERRSLAASAELARRRGAFDGFAESRWAEQGSPPLRNATTTTVAPTGTISIIAGCSSGIEPLFGLSYERNVLDGERLIEVHDEFRRRARKRGIWSEALAQRLSLRGGVRGLEEVPADLQELFATAHDLTPEVHVRMQAAFQRHVHAAVSKTVNFPHEARPEDIARAYRLAYDLGCKGVTVYRDRSLSQQVLAFGPGAVPVPQDGGLPGGPGACPECGTALAGSRGCIACRGCGYSRCG
jgi:ribonucleoside-diphosphate reductase alpha chain